MWCKAVVIGILLLAIDSSDSPDLKECWNVYIQAKYCQPKYEECVLRNGESEKCNASYAACTATSEKKDICLFSVANLVKMTSLERDSNLLTSRKKDSKESKYNCEMKRNLSDYEVPNSSNQILSGFPHLRGSFCLCGNEPDPILDRTSKMGIPTQMYFGGFSTHSCWRELDRYLVEEYCGTQSALEINHEWAKFADCSEDPHQIDCEKRFITGLQTRANDSSSRFRCLQYVEMIKVFLPAAQNVSNDYLITYVKPSDFLYMKDEEYENDRLYLLDVFKNKNDFFTCFTVKRELSSCQYMYDRCPQKEKCGDIMEKCRSSIKEPICKSLLIESKLIEEKTTWHIILMTVFSVVVAPLLAWYAAGKRSALSDSQVEELEQRVEESEQRVEELGLQITKLGLQPRDLISNHRPRTGFHPHRPDGQLEPAHDATGDDHSAANPGNNNEAEHLLPGE